MDKLIGWVKHGHDKKPHKDSSTASGGNAKKKGKDGKKGSTLADFLAQDSENVRKVMDDHHLLWFHGNINRRLAETRLKNGGNKNGLFLIRQSNIVDGDYVLSFVHSPDTYGHYMIAQKADFRYSLRNEEPIEGVDEVVKHYIHKKHGVPFKMTIPLPGDPPPAVCLKAGFTNLLHQTIEKGDSPMAINILDHQLCPDVNSKDGKGYSTLHLAIKHNLLDVVKKLLEKGALMSMCDPHGYTPLQRACRQESDSGAAFVEVLLEGGADPQYRHRDTENVALHEAADLGNKECVQLLLKHGAAAWTRNASSKTPYELAIKKSFQECAQILENFQPPPARSCKKDWFHEKLARQEAVAVMEKHEFRDGLFLVRHSSRNPANYVLTLSFTGACRHYEITKEKNIAYHIDNGPLLSSLPHLVDYYVEHADGLLCRLLTAITPGGELKMINIKDDDLEIYENSAVIYGVHENGGNVYLESKEVMRRGSLPVEPPPPPPPPVNPPPCLFPGSGKHPVILPPESIELGFELGQGEYGSVLRGIWNSETGEKVDVAIKTMNEEGMENSKQQFLQEAEVMVKLNHPCIVALIGVSEGPPLMLVQELVSLGALLDFLLDYPERIDVAVDLTLWAAQVACGMLYLESEGYVHRDLATRNILLAGKQQAKVGDFGLSRAVEGTSEVYRASKGGRWPVKWYAPESINYGQFSHASDVWSFGVTLWEMYTFGEQPYGDMKGAQVVEYLEKGNRLEKPEKCSTIIYDIMCDCWQLESVERPTFRWLLSFFNRSLENGSFRLASQGGVEYSHV